MQRKKKLQITAHNLAFVLPYISRELPDYELVDSSITDWHTAILTLDEPIPPHVPNDATVLRCPIVVGTGMTGLPMEMAKRIAGGSYFHIEGNEACTSTIHASDLAVAVRLSIGHSGCWTVSDGSNPTFNQLAESLSFRLNDRRIYTIKPLMAKLLIPRALRKAITTENTVNGTAFAQKFDFKPTPVTEYLRTHDYNDESL